MPSGKGAALPERSTLEETGSWKEKLGIRVSGNRNGGDELTSESPLGAPAILFSPDSIALSLATVGPSSYSPPRGMAFWFRKMGIIFDEVFGGVLLLKRLNAFFE